MQVLRHTLEQTTKDTQATITAIVDCRHAEHQGRPLHCTSCTTPDSFWCCGTQLDVSMDTGMHTHLRTALTLMLTLPLRRRWHLWAHNTTVDQTVHSQTFLPSGEEQAIAAITTTTGVEFCGPEPQTHTPPDRPSMTQILLTLSEHQTWWYLGRQCYSLLLLGCSSC